MGRILALDPGAKRIGVALSDPSHMIASPLTTISMTAKKALRLELTRLVDEHDVDTVVVGFPVRDDGYEGEGCARSRSLVRILKAAGIPAVLWDESYTTQEAEKVLREGGLGGRKSRAKRDAVAASLILSSYLRGCEDG